MTSDNSKSERIKSKIEASQERLRREHAAPSLKRFPDQYPPEDYRSLAAEYPLLVVAGGLAAGAVLGALLPRSAGRLLGNRAMTAAAMAGELGLALSRTASERAGVASRTGMARIADGTSEVRQRAGRAAGTARSTGLSLARHAIKLAARSRG